MEKITINIRLEKDVEEIELSKLINNLSPTIKDCCKDIVINIFKRKE